MSASVTRSIVEAEKEEVCEIMPQYAERRVLNRNESKDHPESISFRLQAQNEAERRERTIERNQFA